MLGVQKRNLARVLLTSIFGVAAGCTGEHSSEDATDSGEPTYVDSDQDLIPDVYEGPWDSDGDGTLDYLDSDSDNDRIPDAVEAGDSDPLTSPIDSDRDGLPDYRDADSDDNGVPDLYEYGTDPTQPLDLDKDGIPDFQDPDNDGDTILDRIEMGESQPRDTDADGTPDYLDDDSDQDHILDRDEAHLHSDGSPGDTDQDELPDYRDLDSDADGFSDRDEAGDDDLQTPARDTDQDDSPDFVDQDSDGDALSEAQEVALGTDPYAYDSDGDGYSDGGEAAAGSNALNSGSVPLGIYVVIPQRSVQELSFEFTAEIGRADVVFVLDTTGSMGPTLSSLADNFSTVVAEISSIIPDSAFAVSSFKDYNASGMGSGGDNPFYLNQQITTDLAAVQVALSDLSDSGGGDLMESAIEALFQGATGFGFDQDCDGTYDSMSDLAPFLASSNDLFRGAVNGTYNSADRSTGAIGGVGIRQYALPVYVWTTDTDFRDPDDGDPVPGGCDNSASSSRVAEAMNDIGGKLIGINAGDEGVLTEHMEELALDTRSLADLNGDSESDPLVFSSQGGPDIVDAIVEGITALHVGGEFQTVELQVNGDEWGFVQAIDPASYSRVLPGDTLTFSLSLFGASPANPDDQIFELELVVVGDGATSLDSQQILVVVPGG